MSTERQMDRLKTDTERLFSGITGLPITQATLFPELERMAIKPHQGPMEFSSDIVLGDPEEGYKLKTRIKLTDEWTHGEYLPDIFWQVDYSGKPLKQRHIVSVSGVTDRELRKGGSKVVEEFLVEEYRVLMGGPSVDTYRMNFNDRVLDPVINSDHDNNSMYLTIMSDMKARKLPMPPILQQNHEISLAIKRGDVNAVEKQLAAALIFEGAQLDSRCQSHMQLEAEAIRCRVMKEAIKRDPRVDLKTAFPWIQEQEIGRGNNNSKPINILVVEMEDELYTDDVLTQMVVDALVRDGRHGNTTLLTETRLAECLDLCRSGRIDLILFDSTRPADGEGLMFQGNRNPFFHLANGETSAVITQGDDGLKYGLADGRVLDQVEMDHATAELDIRNKWGEMIAAACRDMQVEPPPFFVVRNRSERQDLAKIIAQKLNMPLK